MIGRVGRVSLQALRIAFAASLLLAAGIGLIDAVEMYRHSSEFRDARRCPAGQTGDCLSEERAVVREDGHFWDIRIGVDDNRRVEGLTLRGDEEPAPGTRVVAQLWNGEIVAVRDPATETVYRTYDWPVRWEWADLVLAPILAVLGIAVAPGRLLRRPVRRWRAARASASTRRPPAPRPRRRRAPPASG